MAESIMNIGKNAILPFDPRKMKLGLGSAEYIALEVFVSAVVRKIMKAPKGYMELVAIHAISLPFMGGAVGFVDNNADIAKSPAQYGELFMDGAKGVPAVLLAQGPPHVLFRLRVPVVQYEGLAYHSRNQGHYPTTCGLRLQVLTR